MHPMPAGNSRLVDLFEPYLVASAVGAAGEPRPAPPDMGLAPLHRVDPHRVASSEFLELLQRLDTLAYGPVGMELPRWAFYDCAEVPGGIFGFAMESQRLPDDVRALMQVGAGRSPVPLSMLVAIPMLPPGAWHIYGLCAINEIVGGYEGLRALTLAAGLKMLGVETAYGAAQWLSIELPVHARFAPLELLTAWTPAHTNPATLTWRFKVTPQRVAAALDSGPDPDGDNVRWVEAEDHGALQSIQAELEAGVRLEIVGPPSTGDSAVRVPLREVQP